jgi:lactoylglutathione lyase
MAAPPVRVEGGEGRPEPPLHFSRLRILTPNFARMWNFYRDDLGLTPGMGDETGPYAEFLEGKNSYLALFDAELMSAALAEKFAPAGPSSPGSYALVLQTDDVDSAYQRLIEAGVRFVRPPTDQPLWRIRVAHLRDPDGNLVELYTDFPEGAGGNDGGVG